MPIACLCGVSLLNREETRHAKGGALHGSLCVGSLTLCSLPRVALRLSARVCAAVRMGVCVCPLQIIASGSSVYDIPWPPQFLSFISSMRLFLMDVVSITKANCAQRMDYFTSMMLVLIGLKVALFFLLVGPWLLQRLLQSGTWCGTRLRSRAVQVRGGCGCYHAVVPRQSGDCPRFGYHLVTPRILTR